MEQYYSVNFVAEKLDLNPETIYRAIREKRLQATKFGRNLRISQTALARYLEACNV